MKNIIDSSAWIEIFLNPQYAKHFLAVSENFDDLIVPSIVILEVFRKLFKAKDKDTALKAVAFLQQGEVAELDGELALMAASYNLPTADSIIYATAQQHGATLWTMDTDFIGLPGVKYFPKTK